MIPSVNVHSEMRPDDLKVGFELGEFLSTQLVSVTNIPPQQRLRPTPMNPHEGPDSQSNVTSVMRGSLTPEDERSKRSDSSSVWGAFVEGRLRLTFPRENGRSIHANLNAVVADSVWRCPLHAVLSW